MLLLLTSWIVLVPTAATVADAIGSCGSDGDAVSSCTDSDDATAIGAVGSVTVTVADDDDVTIVDCTAGNGVNADDADAGDIGANSGPNALAEWVYAGVITITEESIVSIGTIAEGSTSSAAAAAAAVAAALLISAVIPSLALVPVLLSTAFTTSYKLDVVAVPVYKGIRASSSIARAPVAVSLDA
jgi:hypothetical protein